METKNLSETDFGARHGGSEWGLFLVGIINIAAAIVVLGGVTWLGGSGLHTDAKALIVIAVVGAAFVTDLVIIILFFQLRYVLVILLGLTAIAVLIWGCMSVFYRLL